MRTSLVTIQATWSQYVGAAFRHVLRRLTNATLGRLSREGTAHTVGRPTIGGESNKVPTNPGSQQTSSPGGTESELPPGQALTEALRRLIREEAGKPPAQEHQNGVTIWQASFLVLFTIDVVLLIGVMFPESLTDHPAIALASKVVPAILGTVLVAFFDGIRGTLLTWARNTRFRIGVVLTALPLGILQTPLLHLPIEMEFTRAQAYLLLPDAPLVDSEGELNEHLGQPIVRGRSRYFVLPNGLRSYDIAIQRTSVAEDGPEVYKYRLSLGKRDVLKSVVTRRRIYLTVPGTITAKLDDSVASRAWYLRVQGEVPQVIRKMIAREYESGGRGKDFYYLIPLPEEYRHWAGILLPPGIYQLRLESESGCTTSVLPDLEVKGARFNGVYIFSAETCAGLTM